MADNTFRQLRQHAVTLVNRFARAEAGATLMLFAVMAVAIVASVGAMVDYGRASNLRSELQSAADAAALAGGRHIALDQDQFATVVRAHFDGNVRLPAGALINNFSATATNGVIAVTVNGSVKSTFLGVVAIDTVDVAITSRAGFSATPVELALVLDNTGSMEPYMGDLKSSAKKLVDMLYDRGGEDNIDIAVVPFVGAVNIGPGAVGNGWMDTAGDASNHGIWFEGRWAGRDPGCTPSGGGGTPSNPGSGTGGSDRGAFLNDAVRRFGRAFANIFVPSAHAATMADVPAGYGLTGDGCYLINPARVNVFDLFAAMPNTTWKGCVEARPEPYDVTDAAPGSGGADTRWVPYLWPDESDPFDTWVYPFTNNYIVDDESAMQPVFSLDDGTYFHTYWVGKYNGSMATVDESGPESHGPNKSCPDAILPLGGNRSQVISKLDGLSHWYGSGTNAAQGVVWGWRVLSPGEPFSQGKPAGQTRKIMVLMTDGKNGVVDQADSATWSDFNAYGYVKQGRITPETYDAHKTYLDQRLQLACANSKADDVTIYTITFGAIDAATEALYEQCASQPPYHYSASTVDDLEKAFGDIGEHITRIRLMD